MPRYRKISTNIWTSPAFRKIPPAQKMEVIEDICHGRDVGIFNEFAGPWFRSKSESSGRRRRDLATSAWKRMRAFILERDQGICYYCGRDCTFEGPTVDHVKPVSCGGRILDPLNLVCACRPCNSRKSDTEFFA